MKPPNRPPASQPDSGDASAENTENTEKKGYTETDSALFTTAEFGSGVVIVGITEEGRSLDSIVIPSEIDNKSVLAVGENAFSSCSVLREVVIPASVIQLYDRAFIGCTNLERIVLTAGAASAVSVGENLMSGADKAFIYVPSDAYVSFVSDYFWSHYSAALRTDNK